ncbi:MAG TPA: MFS transporter, partial [Firmicutes bacterium]|nr:MFS transporter [Bacillota bacterium]
MAQTPQLSSRRRRLLIGLYVLVTLLYWISLYLYLPTLPTYTQSRTESLAMVGTVLAQYGLWQAISRLPIGIGADWIGRRKPFIVAGLLLSGVGAYVMGTAGGTSGLLVGRAISGLAAATWVPLTVIFSSFFPAREAVRATSLLTAVGSVGRVLST